MTPPTGKIVLVRHGPVALRERHWITAAQLKDWVTCYDDADLANTAVPDTVLTTATGCAALVASPLRRSRQSAAPLAQGRDVLVHDLFAEAGLPIPSWPRVAMPVPAWALLLRIGWYLGWSAGSESRRDAMARAGRAADLLQQLSQRHGSVLHVGHGILLSHIGSQLTARGWRTADRPIARNWAMRVFQR